MGACTVGSRSVHVCVFSLYSMRAHVFLSGLRDELVIILPGLRISVSQHVIMGPLH